MGNPINEESAYSIKEDFIEELVTIRKQKKINQSAFPIPQKTISQIENGLTDPKLSTLISYLSTLDINIYKLIQDETGIKRPSPAMVEHLNFKLKDMGSTLQYVQKRDDGNIIVFDLEIIDPFIDYKDYALNLPITQELEAMIRAFFLQYGIVHTGYSNTVCTLFVSKQ